MMMTDAMRDLPERGFVRPTFKVMRGDVIRVPNVAGMSVDGARARLQQAGFGVAVAKGRAYSLSTEKGRVAGSSPGGGSAAYQGQTITLIISKGPPPIPEPDPENTTPPPGGGGGVPRYCQKHPERPGCPPVPGQGG
jgi:hypothetical protein